MKRIAGSFLILLCFVSTCGADATASGKLPSISQVQSHLRKVFYTIRPDLRGRGVSLEAVGGDLDNAKGEWIRVRGEFRGPSGWAGRRVYFRLAYRLTDGRPADVRLVEGVLQASGQRGESSPVFYRGIGLPAFPAGGR